MRGATALFGAIIVASTFTIPYNAARPHFHAQVQTERPEVPLTWDDAAMASLEVPLADPKGSPKHVPAAYYYKIPVRPIYKQYPVYAPGHEPGGYLDRLKHAEPEILWDESTTPPLKTDVDWVRAGKIVFEAPVVIDDEDGHGVLSAGDIRSSEFYKKTGMPISQDGRMPFASYVIRKKGSVEVGQFACSMCHTRVLPDGTTIEGAQGNVAFDRSVAYAMRELRPPAQAYYAAERQLFSAPWLEPDPEAVLNGMSLEETASVYDAIPPGVMARQRSSPLYPPQIPDLIGVKDRSYLDRTGLQRHFGAVDLMRFAALNQGGDDLASFAGFIPVDAPEFKKLPDPAAKSVGGRYSDTQLYALARYVYSLEPPPNPNKPDALAARGKVIFEREGCGLCHAPPIYTNNRLTPVKGFTPSAEAYKSDKVMNVSVGTDSRLALNTRRGTGYYKVPSLMGVWYRGPFEHNGSVATLEDWFDPKRLDEDYVPTGFKGYGVKTRAVKGHRFGLDLSEQDRKALIAFLKTL